MSEPIVVSRETLDGMRCQCGHRDCHREIYFHSSCHPTSATWTRYAHGVATVECRECGKTVIRLPIKERDDER